MEEVNSSVPVDLWGRIIKVKVFEDHNRAILFSSPLSEGSRSDCGSVHGDEDLSCERVNDSFSEDQPVSPFGQNPDDNEINKDDNGTCNVFFENVNSIIIGALLFLMLAHYTLLTRKVIRRIHPSYKTLVVWMVFWEVLALTILNVEFCVLEYPGFECSRKTTRGQALDFCEFP